MFGSIEPGGKAGRFQLSEGPERSTAVRQTVMRAPQWRHFVYELDNSGLSCTPETLLEETVANCTSCSTYMMERKAKAVGGPAAGSSRSKPLVSFVLECRIESRQNMLLDLRAYAFSVL